MARRPLSEARPDIRGRYRSCQDDPYRRHLCKSVARASQQRMQAYAYFFILYQQYKNSTERPDIDELAANELASCKADPGPFRHCIRRRGDSAHLRHTACDTVRKASFPLRAGLLITPGHAGLPTAVVHRHCSIVRCCQDPGYVKPDLLHGLRTPFPSVAFQSALASFIVTMPLTMRSAAMIRTGVIASPRTVIPTTNAPTAPMPVQIV